MVNAKALVGYSPSPFGARPPLSARVRLATGAETEPAQHPQPMQLPRALWPFARRAVRSQAFQALCAPGHSGGFRIACIVEACDGDGRRASNAFARMRCATSSASAVLLVPPWPSSAPPASLSSARLASLTRTSSPSRLRPLYVATLQRCFNARRKQLLAAREERQKDLDARGAAALGFLESTAHVRARPCGPPRRDYRSAAHVSNRTPTETARAHGRPCPLAGGAHSPRSGRAQ